MMVYVCNLMSHCLVLSKDKLPHLLAWMEDFRLGEATLGMKFCVEPDFDVEHLPILHLDIGK